RLVRVSLLREGDRGKGADDRPGPAEPLSTDPWGGLPPARPERRQGRRHVRGVGRHRTSHDRTNVLISQEDPWPGTAIRTSPNAIARRPIHWIARSRSPSSPTAT